MSKNNDVFFAVIIALLILLVFGGGFGMMGFGGCGGMYGIVNGFYGWFKFMWIFGLIITILFAIALVLVILWLIKQLLERK